MVVHFVFFFTKRQLCSFQLIFLMFASLTIMRTFSKAIAKEKEALNGKFLKKPISER